MKVEHVRKIMKALTNVHRTNMKPWSGKLPQPRESPLMTLGDCAVKFKRGKWQVMRSTLSEALCSSPPPATSRTAETLGTRHSMIQIQNTGDLVSALDRQMLFRSESIATSGGPSDGVQHGPCGLIGLGQWRSHGGKLAPRFLLDTCDPRLTKKL
jgi:hypothetical protein